MRKTITYTVTDEGRDKGKVFLLEEMSADAAERWALRFIFALMNTGIDLPDDIENMGMSGVFVMGLRAIGRVPFTIAEPLLDDLMGCIKIIPDPGTPNVTRKIFEADIEEVRTRLTLKKEVFNLHTDFFTVAAP